MAIKGMEKLNSAIARPLKERFGINSAECSDEYAYLYDTQTVTFKITEGEIEDIWLTEFIKERFNYDVKSSFMICILHEIGHHMANDEIEGSIYEFCIKEKERIETEMQTASAEYSKVLEWQYFNLPDEIMATQWAVNFARKHPIIVKKMYDEMIAALREFYLVNNVTEN